MYILGINGTYHDMAAALLRDGQLVAAAEEERFNRQKHGKLANPYNAWELPLQAIDYCLREANITINEVDHIAYSFKPWLRVWNAIPLLFYQFRHGRFNQLVREAMYFWFTRTFVSSLLTSARQRRMHRLLVFDRRLPFRIHFVEHHLAHAASAFFVSPFDEAAILSIDGTGELVSTLMAEGRGNRIRKLKELKRQHSLGFFYEEVTTALGFTKNEDEYKVMALSAFGIPCYQEEFRRLITTHPDGTFRVKMDVFRPSLFGPVELQHISGLPRLWGAPIEQRHKNAAASAQRILEEVVLYLCNTLRQWTKMMNLCLAGGVALNCVMNEKLLQRSGFKDIYVQPAAHDAGTALGAALWVYHVVLNRPRSSGFQMTHAFWGPGYSDQEIEECLKRYGIRYKRPPSITQETARLLSEGKIVAWFQGRMEWGPRALGARSILASPCDVRIREQLNLIKGREEFQPYAASVLEDKAHEWFEVDRPSRFMLFAKKVRSEKKAFIPAVLHADDTSRIQTVDRYSLPIFYELIKEFERLTNVPLLLNTSFNRKGEPIVCSPEDALECFFASPLKYLAIGSFLVEK